MGLQISPTRDFDLQQYGGLEIPFGLGASARIAPTVWLGGEVRGVPNVGVGLVEVPGSDELRRIATTPLEVFLTLRTSFGAEDPRGPFAIAAGGLGLTQAVGSARGGRGMIGVGWQGGADDAGFPPFRVRALAPDGEPLADAVLRLGSREVGRTGPDGEARLEMRSPPQQLVLEADGFEALVFDVGPKADPERAIEVVPPWPAREAPLRVTDEDGALLTPTWSATSVDDPLGPPLEGEGPVMLPPGIWDVRVAAEDLGPQARRVRIAPRDDDPHEVDVVLLAPAGPATVSLRVANVDEEGIEGAQVLVDGQVVGTTGHDGRVTVEAVTADPHRIEVQHPDYTTATVDVSPGEDATPVILSRQRGSVRVTVRNALGEPVRDAVARFVGPRRLPPLPLGGTGQRGLVLGAGAWTLLVSSPSSGVQERAIEVPEDGWELIDVVVVLQRDEAGEADVVIRVQDPRGRPVPGVDLRLDEQDLGTTSTGGTVALRGLTASPRVLEVVGDGLRPVDPIRLDLVPGPQEAVVSVRFDAGLVDVIARSEAGPVSDGVIRFLGPSSRPPLPLDPSGRERLTLPPGRWTVLLTSGTYGAQQRQLDIAEDSDVLHVVEFLVRPTEGGRAELALQVSDPLGRPIDGARVALDAQPVGATSNAGRLRVQGLVARTRTLDIEAAMHRPVRESVALSGAVERRYVMGWDAGVVRATVVRDGTPIDDAVVRFFGPDRRAPRPVDARGRALAQLQPGRWTVLATSTTSGVGEATVTVPETPGLTDVTVTVVPAAAGRTDLVVRVTDVRGQPIDGARVSIADAEPLRAADGLVVARGLPRR
ncbi:MAG: carboxypeptidase-like regulatory domain-containing protein, partial [Myxococcota bacterium]